MNYKFVSSLFLPSKSFSRNPSGFTRRFFNHKIKMFNNGLSDNCKKILLYNKEKLKDNWIVYIDRKLKTNIKIMEDISEVKIPYIFYDFEEDNGVFNNKLKTCIDVMGFNKSEDFFIWIDFSDSLVLDLFSEIEQKFIIDKISNNNPGLICEWERFRSFNHYLGGRPIQPQNSIFAFSYKTKDFLNLSYSNNYDADQLSFLETFTNNYNIKQKDMTFDWLRQFSSEGLFRVHNELHKIKTYKENDTFDPKIYHAHKIDDLI